MSFNNSPASSTDDSLDSDARSKNVELEKLKEGVYEDADVFEAKLGDVRLFIRNTRTSRDEIRASIRCLAKCNYHLSGVLAMFLREDIEVQPVALDSEEFSNDQLRSNAIELLKFLKRKTLSSFVSGFLSRLCKDSFPLVKNAFEECVTLIDRVMKEGYDCRSSSSSSDDVDHVSETEED